MSKGRTLTLLDIAARTLPPAPWAEGDNIPWDEPTFSERMLREHLSQHHEMASRRFEDVRLLRSLLGADTDDPSSPANIVVAGRRP